ncbi:MAG: DoxX family membrane protein [Bacteroidales bacterium]|jgi:uncharacterized membrane protein YphA (DoxX/SURF4 family)|nr:DoxX family membrane protein [Bacteroidales bacterium]
MSKKKIGLVFRILLGLTFIASAALKYLSIGATDIFLFEHKILPWTLTQFATRLLIAFEGGLGLMLILGIKPRLTRILTFLTLILFTIYLLLKPLLFGNTSENCHCFGTYIQLTHFQSIAKNVVMLLMACMIGWAGAWKTRFAALIMIIIALLTTATTFIIYPPDIIFTKIYNRESTLDKEGFKAMMELDDVKALNLENGKKVLCMYSTGCKYCKQTAIRVEVMIEKYGLDRTDFATIFWGNDKNLAKFHTDTQTPELATTIVHPLIFLKATKGKQPLIILLDNGKIEEIYNSVTLNESKLVQFIRNN